MKAISRYKSLIQELRYIFANLEVDRPSLPLLEKEQTKVMHYANRIVGEIKEELIGDGDEAKFMGRLKTAFFELGADPNFAPSYFPVFDEALFELPSKDEPDRNRQMLDALTDVYGGDAADVMVSLQTTAQWANFMVQDMAKMLDEVCKFVGFTPELKGQPETEQEQKLKSLFPDDMAKNEKAMTILLNAVNDGAINIINDGAKERLKFNGSNALLAYMLGIAFCGDTKEHDKYKQGYKVKRGSAFFPDAFLSKLFGVSNLGQSRLQLDSLPRGYERVDKWLV